MASTAILAVRIISDAKGAAAGLDSTSSKLGKLGGVAKAAGLALAGALAAGTVAAVKGAADLEQSIGAIDTVFGRNADRMHKWAKGAATDVGLTRNEFNELGTLIGAQLKNGGTAMDQLAPKTNNLIGLGADLSSMFGGSTKEAVEALSSALKGERDPIEKYGVTLRQSSIDAEAARLGYEKVGGSLSAQAQQAATLSLIYKQTSDAQGNFARESGTLAHQQQVLSATVSNLKDQIGTALLPIVTRLFTWINTTAIPVGKQLVGAFRQMMAGGGGFGGVMERLRPALDAARGVMQVVATNVAPIVIAAFRKIVPPVLGVVRALGGLVTAILQRAQPVIRGLLPVIRAVFQGAAKVVGAAMRVVSGVIRTITAVIAGDWSGAWDGIKDTVKAAWGLIKSIVSAGIGLIKGIVKTGWNTIKGLFDDAWDAIGRAVSSGIDRVVGFVRALPGRILGGLGNLGSLLYDAGSSVIQGLIDGITAKVSALQSKLSSVTKLIPDWKGPAKKDARLLRPAGQLIIGGLIDGIDRTLPDLRRALGRVSREVAAQTFTTAPVNVGPVTGTRTGARGRTGAPVTVNINVNGLVTDPQGTARQIAGLLNNYGILTGSPA